MRPNSGSAPVHPCGEATPVVTHRYGGVVAVGGPGTGWRDNHLVGVPIAAVILAGGEGRRLGGIDKPSLSVAGRSLLQVAIDAVAPYADAVASGAVDIDARSIDAGPYTGPVEARRIALSVD